MEVIMNTAPKSTKEATEKAEATAHLPGAFATVYNKGLERMVQVQKAALEVAAHQTTDFLEVCKKAVSVVPSMPGMYLFDLAAQAVTKGVEVQKDILDEMLEQNTSIVEFAKSRYEAAGSKAPADATHLMQQSLDRIIGMQKSVLDYAAQQNKAFSDAMRQHGGMTGTMGAAAESMQKGMGTLIDTQKELLEIVSKPMKAAAKTA
jgi:hypothetical protein